MLKIATVSAEASYVARASSHWADHAKNPGSKSWMTYAARPGGRPYASACQVRIRPTSSAVVQ